MEDGSFNTRDEEEYELIENSLIGLVQPFPQLQRKVYSVTEEEKR